MRSKLLAMIVLAFALGTSAVTTGCAPTLTPADIDHYGVRSYPGASKAQAFKASVAALKSLGSDTALVDEAGGRVKSAPKLMVVHASGNEYSARATGSSLAWDIEVTAESSGAVVHATPRGYEGGQSVPTSRMNADYMKRTWDTLFSEIESSLPRKVASTHAAR
jgi:hypothetical protein